jgi:hypothetical protein
LDATAEVQIVSVVVAEDHYAADWKGRIPHAHAGAAGEKVYGAGLIGRVRNTGRQRRKRRESIRE